MTGRGQVSGNGKEEEGERSHVCKGPGWEKRAVRGAAHELGEAGRSGPCRLRKKEMNGLLPSKENMQREGGSLQSS